MKKFLLIAASAALVLSSCMKNEVVVNPDRQKAIEFSAYVGKAPVTKGTDLVSSDFKTTGFHVEAEYKGEYTSATVTNSGDGWEAPSDFYWPSLTEAVRFRAWYPANAVTGEGTYNITLTNVHDTNIDIVAAYKEATYNNAAVELVFKHVLSKIGVTATMDSSNESLSAKITDLTISGFPTNATIRFAEGNCVAAATDEPGSLTLDFVTDEISTESLAQGVETAGYFICPGALTLEIKVSYNIYHTGATEPVGVVTDEPYSLEYSFAANTKYNINLTLPAMANVPITFNVTETEWTEGSTGIAVPSKE